MTPAAGPILQLLVSTRPGGGPQHVALLARGLRARGWEPIVAAPADGVLFDGFAKAGIEIVEVATNRLRPATLLQVVRLVRRRGVVLVHSHGKGAGIYGRLAARLAGVPAVHTLHGIHYERYAPPARAAYLALERRLSSWSARVVNVSREQEREGLALRLFDARRSRVIPNGVDVARLGALALGRADARAELKVPGSATVVGAVARFDEVKRLDVLVDAVARVRGITLVLIGDGAESARLRALAAQRGLGPRVVFAGEVDGAAQLLPAFDVYASPSRKEGMPMAVLEAMALGLPVVASDIPAHREVLGAGSLGLVAGTVDAFAAALERLGRDAILRSVLGAENRTRARSEFDAREMLGALEALYGEVLRL
jgi:glycosyltransferase involved in cell wall biosynthesis